MLLSRVHGTIVCLLLMMMSGIVAKAQPTLPDMTGSNENGLVLLSWVCQYDGVKSIAVLRSADSNFNYSTIGYVKKLYKGVQGYIDGHPYPGKNFYKLAVVFNSGLTWTCNHYGVYVDSAILSKHRVIQPNEALQKLIVTEDLEQMASTNATKPKKTNAPADRDKYVEVIKKDTAKPKKPDFKLDNGIEESDLNTYLDAFSEAKRPKISVSYDDDLENLNSAVNTPGSDKPTPQRNKISISFDDKEDVQAFVDNLPKSPGRKLTISYDADPGDIVAPKITAKSDQQTAPAEKKKISLTFKDEAEMAAYVESLPKSANRKITLSYNVDSNELRGMKYVSTTPRPTAKPAAEEPTTPVEPPKPKIKIKFTDDINMNASSEIKSKYISMDNITGHVKLKLPDDIAAHHYSIKFFDKDNRAVIEVPKLNASSIIFDKRNFQKKGQYKFTIKKDALELESGTISIY